MRILTLKLYGCIISCLTLMILRRHINLFDLTETSNVEQLLLIVLSLLSLLNLLPLRCWPSKWFPVVSFPISSWFVIALSTCPGNADQSTSTQHPHYGGKTQPYVPATLPLAFQISNLPGTPSSPCHQSVTHGDLA